MVICLLLGGWLAWEAGKAIQTGTANAGGIRHRKAKRPIRFWATIAIQMLLALSSIIVLLDLLARVEVVS